MKTLLLSSMLAVLLMPLRTVNAKTSTTTTTTTTTTKTVHKHSVSHSHAKKHSSTQHKAAKKETTVWVNTKSGVYHYPGQRWYGNTKEGKYMPESEVRKAG